MLVPYETENLIFIDTEFSDLNPYTGELLSIGIVKLSGESLYIELEALAKNNEWVEKHVMPLLTAEKVPPVAAKVAIEQFLEGKMPYAVAFVDNYDVIYLTKLFGAGNLPFRWMTIDMASILFAIGVNPVKFQRDGSGAKAFYRKLGIDTKAFRQHHALDDAKLLREVWLRLVTEVPE